MAKRVNPFRKARTHTTEDIKRSLSNSPYSQPLISLKLPDMSYTPVGMDNEDFFSLRKEYGRIRGIVKKRAKRLKDAGFKSTKLSKWADDLLTPTEIGADTEKLKNMMELAMELYKEATLWNVRETEKQIEFLRYNLDIPFDIGSDAIGEFWRIARELLDVASMDSQRINDDIHKAVGQGDNEYELKKLAYEVFTVMLKGRDY